jgi:hypothetical protein
MPSPENSAVSLKLFLNPPQLLRIALCLIDSTAAGDLNSRSPLDVNFGGGSVRERALERLIFTCPEIRESLQTRIC